MFPGYHPSSYVPWLSPLPCQQGLLCSLVITPTLSARPPMFPDYHPYLVSKASYVPWLSPLPCQQGLLCSLIITPTPCQQVLLCSLVITPTLSARPAMFPDYHPYLVSKALMFPG